MGKSSCSPHLKMVHFTLKALVGKGGVFHVFKLFFFLILELLQSLQVVIKSLETLKSVES